MVKRIFYCLGVLLFGYACFVQLNDPDWIEWIAIYGVAAVSNIAALFNRGPRQRTSFMIVGMYLVLVLVVGSGLWDIPSPHKEKMMTDERWLEVGGLLISAGWMAVLGCLAKNRS